MKRLIIFLFLLCLAAVPGKAQLVDPGDGPGDIGVYVAEIGGNSYTTLAKAFEDIKSEGQKIKLLTSVTFHEKIVLKYSATLNLNGQTLTCVSGTSFAIAAGKTLKLEKGTVTGSFSFHDGQLFAGQDVTLTGCGIRSGGTNSQNLYRILVRLADATGSVSDPSYGSPFTRWAQQAEILCCWLPQSVEARSITFGFTPDGGSKALYNTLPLIVTLHAEGIVASSLDQGGSIDAYVAKSLVPGGSAVSHKSLSEAFDAVKTTGGTLELLASCTLGNIPSLTAAVTLDLKGLTLGSSGTSGFLTSGNGRLLITNSGTGGGMNGTFSITGEVLADQSVQLSAAIMQDGKQVYRTRLTLPDGTTAATFSYGNITDKTLSVRTENSRALAYLWLPAHTAAPLVLHITAPADLQGSTTHSNVTIQTNHDNRLDLSIGGDIEAILYKRGEGVDTGIRYGNFSTALAAACQEDGSQLWLQRDVQLNDNHAIGAGTKTTLQLNGHTLTVGGALLDASEEGSCIFVTDVVGTGRITGTCKMKGHIYLGKDIATGNLGTVQQADGTHLYRLLAQVEGGTGVTDGFISYRLGTGAVQSCFLQDKLACLWLPINTQPETLALTVGGKIYSASAVQVSASHSNTVIVKEPAVVAKITSGDRAQNFTSLSAALSAAREKDEVQLLQSTTLATAVAIPDGSALTLDLQGFTISTSATAGFATVGSGNLLIRSSQAQGVIQGNFTVTDAVCIPGSVSLSGLVTREGKTVYRTRLTLPAGITAASYSYDKPAIRTPLTLQAEEGVAVSYLWLPVHVAAPFALYITEPTAQAGTKTKNNVMIQASHDNRIDMLSGGDAEAILYVAGEVPGVGIGTPYDTFHEALTAAGRVDGSQLWLQTDVLFGGEREHDHLIAKEVRTELKLNGHLLTATNCILDASDEGACLVISDADGTGRITGTFKIKGNVYIGSDLAAGSIGIIRAGDVVRSLPSGTQLYRMLARIETANAAEGFASWQLGADLSGSCYVKDRVACLWLPIHARPETLTLTFNGNTYAATDILVSAGHSNTVSLKEPTAVASISVNGATRTFTSLPDAFASAADREVIRLLQNTTLATEVAIAAGMRVSLDLREFTLTTLGEAGFEVGASAILLIRSENQRGILSGNFSLSGEVCVLGTVSLTGQVMQKGKTVYRSRFFLPSGTTAATYTYNVQNGSISFPDEKDGQGQAVGYAWLQTITGTHDLMVQITAPQAEYKTLTDVLVQATHNNQFDMQAGDDMAKVGDRYYPTLAAALAVANAAGGTTIQLVKDQSFRGMLNINTPIVLDLNGCKLSAMADAAFDVSDKASLLVTDLSGLADKGMLYGTLLLNGPVYVSGDVTLSGMIVRKEGEVYRSLITDLPVPAAGVSQGTTPQRISCREAVSGSELTALLLNGMACLWLPATEAERELEFAPTDKGAVFEATLLAGIRDHRTRARAYQVVKVTSDVVWADGTNKDRNIVVAPGVTLTIAANGALPSVHRLTLGTGSQVLCHERVLATGGIVYRRSFAVANRWESFSLPFAAQRVTAVFNGEPVPLNPNLSDGTGGHFWLKTLAGDGTFNYVTEPQIRSNVGYILAVPANLTTEGNPEQAIRFASAPNQFLERTALVGVPPETTGFLQLATGILCALPMTDPFYLLNAEGTEYVRQLASKDKPMDVPPFSSYLLADKETTDQLPTLRMGELPTGNEEVVQPDGLRIRTVNGGILAETDRECRLTVYTLSGRICVHRRIPAGSTRISLAAGIYIVNREKACVTK